MIKVFVIAIKESPRRAKIKADLDALNIAFEFVDAVDAREGLPPQYEKLIDRTLAKKRLGRPMIDEEFGCALSHALVYEKIVAEKIAHSIILEDDAIVGKGFANIIKKDLLPNAPFDMGLLYINFFLAVGKKQYLGDYQYYKVAFMPSGTVGYYLNLAVAKTLKTATEVISHYADYPIAIDQKHRVIAFFPRLVYHPKVTKSQSFVTQKNPQNQIQKTDRSQGLPQEQVLLYCKQGLSWLFLGVFKTKVFLEIL